MIMSSSILQSKEELINWICRSHSDSNLERQWGGKYEGRLRDKEDRTESPAKVRAPEREERDWRKRGDIGRPQFRSLQNGWCSQNISNQKNTKKSIPRHTIVKLEYQKQTHHKAARQLRQIILYYIIWQPISTATREMEQTESQKVR